MFDTYTIIQYLAAFCAVLVVMSAHEFAHAFAAVKNGDMTPKLSGRYTLNPFAHVNIVGLIMMVLVGFGWAQPVPINPYNFKDMKKGYFWTSVAGVLTNYVLAFVAYPLMLVFRKYGFEFLLFDDFIYYFLNELFILNLCFFVFNLIPIYPLDGFRVLEVAVKSRGRVMRFLREKGQLVLMGLIVLSYIAEIVPMLWFLDIFGFVMDFSVNIVGYPITALWNLLLRNI